MSRADQDPREYSHIECDCVPTLGPSHCHLCETEWPCADRKLADEAQILSAEYHTQMGYGVEPWEDKPVATKKIWLAVVRSAREFRAEK